MSIPDLFLLNEKAFKSFRLFPYTKLKIKFARCKLSHYHGYNGNETDL